MELLKTSGRFNSDAIIPLGTSPIKQVRESRKNEEEERKEKKKKKKRRRKKRKIEGKKERKNNLKAK